MAKGQHLSGHQRAIVNRYYEHLDTITLQKLSEAVSDLFVTTGEKAAARLWKTAETALRRARVEEDRITKVVAGRDVHALATLVGELSAGKGSAR